MGWKKRQPRIYKTPNNQIRYAGRTDLKCFMLPVPEATRKVKTIIDFKTGKTPNPYFHPNGYTEWPLQTASYRNADGECEENGVVHLGKENGVMGWYPYGKTFGLDMNRFRNLVDYWWGTFGLEYADKLEFGAPSVTTVCGVLDKPALVQWAANCAVDYVRENIEPDNGTVSTEELYSILESAKSNYRKVSKKARDIGTMVHKYIEEWIKSDGKMEPPSDSPDEVTASFIAFLDWWKAHKVEPIELEKVVYGR